MAIDVHSVDGMQTPVQACLDEPTQFPEEVSGWTRILPDQDDRIIEYWRSQSTHVQGSFEQLALSTHSKGLSLTRTTYDQFGHRLTGATMYSGSRDKVKRMWSMACKRMGQYPGTGDVSTRPSMTEFVGDWNLERDTFDETVWAWQWGQAELAAEEGGLRSGHAFTTRLYDITYTEYDAEPVTLVTDVPRTKAYEIAVAVMKQIDEPVADASHSLATLQNVTGIGPAKAESFYLLGIDSPDRIQAFIEGDWSVNSNHTKAVEKVLTTTIKESLCTG